MANFVTIRLVGMPDGGGGRALVQPWVAVLDCRLWLSVVATYGTGKPMRLWLAWCWSFGGSIGCHGEVVAANTRYTEARPILSCLAIAVAPRPSLRSLATS